ncbi:MAG: hypothetical protein NWF05_01670 [Candidatus Bathyarchaeota archaeon]|nr:hypothetical protein [Candidatus Bathyarchaeota archaeon]
MTSNSSFLDSLLRSYGFSEIEISVVNECCRSSVKKSKASSVEATAAYA